MPLKKPLHSPVSNSVPTKNISFTSKEVKITEMMHVSAVRKRERGLNLVKKQIHIKTQ